MTARLEDTSNEEERAMRLEVKLQNIEDKLDSVLEILGRQTRPGT